MVEVSSREVVQVLRFSLTVAPTDEVVQTVFVRLQGALCNVGTPFPQVQAERFFRGRGREVSGWFGQFFLRSP